MTCTCPHFDASPVSRYILHRAPCSLGGEVTDPAGNIVDQSPRRPDPEPEIVAFDRRGHGN